MTLDCLYWMYLKVCRGSQWWNFSDVLIHFTFCNAVLTHSKVCIPCPFQPFLALLSLNPANAAPVTHPSGERSVWRYNWNSEKLYRFTERVRCSNVTHSHVLVNRIHISLEPPPLSLPRYFPFFTSALFLKEKGQCTFGSSCLWRRMATNL